MKNVKRMVERSSLGTAKAREARKSVTRSTGRSVVAKSNSQRRSLGG